MLIKFLKSLMSVSERPEIVNTPLPIEEVPTLPLFKSEFKPHAVPDGEDSIKVKDAQIDALIMQIIDMHKYVGRVQANMNEYRKANEDSWRENQEIKQLIRQAVFDLKQWLKSN